MSVNPFRPVQLGASVALSTVLSGGVSTLPPGNFSDVARALVGFCGVALSTKVVCETLVDDANAEATAQESEVQAALTRDLYRANAAYYREFPHHWKARKPVPDEWLELWGQTGGRPYLALHPSSPQAFAPIAQPQPQAQPIQQPGQTRGGSFDRAAATESPGSGWGDYEPRPQPPIAQHQSFTLQSEPDDAWLDRLVAPSVLLVFGGDGSGKTSMALELLRRRQRAGHQVIALDPHAHPAKWPGCEVIGGGLNFGQIEAAIGQLQRLREQRYEQIRSGAIEPCKFPPITFVMEELTDWKSEVSNVDLLILKAGDYRKANIHLLMVTHGDSMSQIGAPTGSNEIIKNCVTKLRLFSKPGADGKPIPAFKGELAYPLQAPIAVSVPRFTTTAQTPPTQAPEAQSTTSFEPSPPPLLHASESPASRHESPRIAPSPQPEASSDREAELLAQFSEMKAMGMNKKQICYAIWGAKMGGTDRYRMASEFYDRLNSKYLEMSGDNAA
jgi:hypothetical protein